MLIKRLGYQNGAVAGFLIAAVGCGLFYPASRGSYAEFLLALFVLAAGITIMQVAANPYVTALGDPARASSRLTLTQAFNSLGTTIAPTLGGMLILSGAVLSSADVANSLRPTENLEAGIERRWLARSSRPFMPCADDTIRGLVSGRYDFIEERRDNESSTSHDVPGSPDAYFGERAGGHDADAARGVGRHPT